MEAATKRAQKQAFEDEKAAEEAERTRQHKRKVTKLAAIEDRLEQEEQDDIEFIGECPFHTTRVWLCLLVVFERRFRSTRLGCTQR